MHLRSLFVATMCGNQDVINYFRVCLFVFDVRLEFLTDMHNFTVQYRIETFVLCIYTPTLIAHTIPGCIPIELFTKEFTGGITDDSCRASLTSIITTFSTEQSPTHGINLTCIIMEF